MQASAISKHKGGNRRLNHSWVEINNCWGSNGTIMEHSSGTHTGRPRWNPESVQRPRPRISVGLPTGTSSMSPEIIKSDFGRGIKMFLLTMTQRYFFVFFLGDEKRQQILCPEVYGQAWEERPAPDQRGGSLGRLDRTGQRRWQAPTVFCNLHRQNQNQYTFNTHSKSEPDYHLPPSPN